MRLSTSLLDELAREGFLGEWRQAFETVDRSCFIPDRGWVPDGDGYRLIDRDADPVAWREAVDSGVAIVTQFDDGDTDADTPGSDAVPTSSSSDVEIMARMLHQLSITGGERVLEVGTGTGYNTALLSYRLGGPAVTSVEVDGAVAAVARRRLTNAGFGPSVYTSDGVLGHRERAPYDRVIATYAVKSVPRSWIAQTRPGGIIVVPWRNGFRNEYLLRLVVGRDEVAVGKLVDGSSFMTDRSQRGYPPVRQAAYIETTTEVGPDWLEHWDANLYAGVKLPGVHLTYGDDGSAILAHPDTRSWARLLPAPADAETWTVRQGGKRRLWDEAADAVTGWFANGKPAAADWTVTVSPEGMTLTR